VSGVASPGSTIWLTGLSGAGKTTTARALRDALASEGRSVIVIDGDELRRGLSSDLGYGAADRDENVRRAGELALLAAAQGSLVVVSLISPRAAARRAVRKRHHDEGIGFAEVYVATPLEVCEARDEKELYKRARAGERLGLTGVDDPYEAPENAEVTISTERQSPEEAARQILDAIS
jgi:bifunctional enzyme CysN/CysC